MYNLGFIQQKMNIAQTNNFLQLPIDIVYLSDTLQYFFVSDAWFSSNKNSKVFRNYFCKLEMWAGPYTLN